MSKKIEPIQSLRGMHDILPDDMKYWDFVINKIRKVCESYGLLKIETPILESTDLFVRGVGKYTDIVEKELYSFTTKGGDHVSLRPEGTAGVARSFIENGMVNLERPIKLYYVGPIFRYEKPQAGRYRQHHQFGFEIIGEDDPIRDAQAILITSRICDELGLKKIVNINSIGCPECRKAYKKLLVEYYEDRYQKLCKDCKRRIKINPMRVLDCKEDKCMIVAGGAPQTIDHLCTVCHNHFRSVLEYLDELELGYILNPNLVRGLDYYTKTVFEILPESSDTRQGSLAGGGRYDFLIEELGGRPTPCVGAGMGLERIIMELKSGNAKIPEKSKSKVFVVQLGDLGKKKSLKLFRDLEKNGIKAEELLGKGSLKTQLKIADEKNAESALIIGQKEAIDGTVIIRDMKSGIQEIVDYGKIIKEIKKRI